MIIKYRIRIRSQKEAKKLREEKLEGKKTKKDNDLIEKQKEQKEGKKQAEKFKKIDAIKVKEESRVKKISILVFIWSVFLFFFGLQYDFLDEIDILIFWLPILLMIGVIIYQIFFLTNNSFVIFEIFFIYLFLHLVFVFGYYGLRGSDSYFDYNFFKGILSGHRFNLMSGVQGYPMLHIFSSIIHFFTKMNPLFIAKFLPSILSSLIVFPLYLLSSKVCGSRRVALFSSLIFGTIPQFISFETSFVREVFGLFITILFFYTLAASLRKEYRKFYVIIFILIPVIILSHHLSSFLLLCLIIIYLTISFGLFYFNKIINYVYKKIQIIKFFPRRLNLNVLLIVFIFSVSITIYWSYLGYDLIGFLRHTILDILGVNPSTGSTYSGYMNLGGSIFTLKGNIIYYGFFFYVFLFSILLLIKIFIKNIKNKIEDSAFLVFYFFCMGLGSLSLFFITGTVFPDRLLTFAFLFGLIPITSYVLVFKKEIVKKIIIILLVSFIIFNLYNIDTHNYTYNASFTGGAVTEKEYLIAKHISFSKPYFGYIAAVAAIYDIQGIEQRSEGLDLVNIYNTDFCNSSSMAVIDESIYQRDLINFQKKSPVEYYKLIELLSYKNGLNVDKICDFGNIYVIKGGG